MHSTPRADLFFDSSQFHADEELIVYGLRGLKGEGSVMPGSLVESISDIDIIPVSDPVVEAHHRIANNLAIIAGLIRSESLTLAAEAQPNSGYIRRLLQQMSLRIEAVGRLHRLLMDTTHGATVELCAYLREIVDAATCSLTNAEHTKILCGFREEIAIPAKQAAAIGLFVSEALVNAIKHAHRLDESGTIWISCKRKARAKLLIEITDDGTGAALDFRPSEKGATGSGARLMRNIAHDLGGGVTFLNGDPGQIVRLELPFVCCPEPLSYAQAAE